MGVRFRKSLKLGDLVKLNFSKTGVSATIGKNGASINLGNKGTYLNLSPTIAGIKGTGVSYRQKITGGYGSLINKIAGKNEVKEKAVENKEVDNSLIEEYKKQLEENINIHKYADKVLNEEEMKKRINEFDSASSKEIYELALNGDEETIEALVGAFLNNLDLNYDVKANYELEENILYVDLDLPEIEDFKDEYPTLNKNEIVYKKKTQAELKEEYAKTIISLGIYLSANFFNVSSFIKQIVLSAFTTKRNSDGDLKDEYLYSVKFNREEFEKTDLDKIDDQNNFLLKFENRINMSSAYSFKSIKPYELVTDNNEDNLIKEAVEGLKELGFKATLINEILPELSKLELNTSGEYIKEALKLLKK